MTNLRTMSVSELTPIDRGDAEVYQFMLDNRRYIILEIKGALYAMTCDMAFSIAGTLIDVLENTSAIPFWAQNDT